MTKIRFGVTVFAFLSSVFMFAVWFGFVGLMVMGLHNLIN